MNELSEHRLLTVGEVAARSGTTTATLRFYESRGLIVSHRTTGNQRRYQRHVLRRIAVIRAAQRLGLSLEEILTAFAHLPTNHAPSPKDWAVMSGSWQVRLDERIAAMTLLRDSLDGCIGCGCLSMTNCPIYNQDDVLGADGPGPRRWLTNQQAPAQDS